MRIKLEVEMDDDEALELMSEMKKFISVLELLSERLERLLEIKDD